MKTFSQLREQLIAEGPNTPDQKAWINYKTGKSFIWKPSKNSGKPWHIQYVCMHPKKFGLTDKKILKMLADDGWVDGEDGAEGVVDDETRENFEYLKSGVLDHSRPISNWLGSKGWMDVYNEDGRGVSGLSTRASIKDLHSAAKVLEKAFKVSSTLDFSNNMVRLGGKPGAVQPIKIGDRFAWKTFLNTGKVVKQKSALAAFR